MKIFLGSDHGGYDLKEKVKTWLQDWSYDFEDLGADQFQPDDDYPDYAFKVAQAVADTNQASGPDEDQALGVLLCRSGGGMTIASNKVRGIRAVPVYSPEEADYARSVNNANIISLSGDWTDDQTAKATLKAFLETDFSHQDRHQRRIDKISQYEIR